MSLYEGIFKTNGFDFPLKRKTSFFLEETSILIKIFQTLLIYLRKQILYFKDTALILILIFNDKLWFSPNYGLSQKKWWPKTLENFLMCIGIYLYDLVYLGKPQCICNIRLIYLKTFINYFKLYLKNSKNVSWNTSAIYLQGAYIWTNKISRLLWQWKCSHN